MGDDQRFEKWATGVLGVVSLILILNLVRMYATRWRAEFAATAFARGAYQPKVMTEAKPPLRAENAIELPPSILPKLVHHVTEAMKQPPPVPKRAKQESASSLQNSSKRMAGSEKFKPRVRPDETTQQLAKAHTNLDLPSASLKTDLVEAELKEAPVAAPVPKVYELQTIGYVERPGGSRQAVVSVGNRVFLVHEGDTFDDHYKVLTISSSSVEVADLAMPASSNAPAPAATPEARPVVRALGATHQTNAIAAADSVPTAAALSELRLASGWKEAAVSAVAGSALMTARQELKEPSPAKVRAGVSGAGGNGLLNGQRHAGRQGQLLEARLMGRQADWESGLTPGKKKAGPIQQVRHLAMNVSAPSSESLGFVERAGLPKEVILALGDEIRLVPQGTEVARNGTDLSSTRAVATDATQPPTPATPIPEGKAKPILFAAGTPANSNTGLSVSLPFESESFIGSNAAALKAVETGLTRNSVGHSPLGVTGPGPPVIRDVSARASRADFNNGRAGPTTRHVLTFKPYCYVERADGTREAFILFDGQAYLVFQGEIFANGYRVLGVSHLAVEVADERGQENKSPPQLSVKLAKNSAIAHSTDASVLAAFPEILPLTDSVRTLPLSFAETDPVSSLRLAYGVRERLQTQVGPTLPPGRSSIVSVPQGVADLITNARPIAPLLDPPSLAELLDRSSGPADSDTNLVEAESETRSNLHAPSLGRLPITPLPLTEGRELTQLMPGIREDTFVSSAPSDPSSGLERSKAGEAGPSTSDHSGRADSVATSASTPVGQLASLGALHSPEGNSLLLPFSIGDNGCYFP